MSKNVTIRDVARECGVSPMTVSRVINRDKNVKTETQQQIVSTIKRLNYSPSKNIPFLKKNKTRTIGLVGPATEVYQELFFMNSGILEFDQVMYGMGFEPRHFYDQAFYEKIRKGGHIFESGSMPDGLVFFCPRGDWRETVTELKKWGVPMVLIRRRSPLPCIPSLLNTDQDNIVELLSHLRAHGHRRVGLVGIRTRQGDKRKYQDYATLFEEAGLPYDASLVYRKAYGDYHNLGEWLSGRTGGSDPMTAVVCADDVSAANVIKKVTGMGLSVPGDVAVTGYNNTYLAEVYNPGITSVDIPVKDMMNMAGKIMFDLVQGAPVESFEIIMRSEVVYRESCGGKLTPGTV